MRHTVFSDLEDRGRTPHPKTDVEVPVVRLVARAVGRAPADLDTDLYPNHRFPLVQAAWRPFQGIKFHRFFKTSS